MAEIFGNAWVWAVIAAPFVGSFLGVLILRLPAGLPVAWARSACPHCGRELAPIDLAPLASWLSSGGKCRYCASPLGRFYPGIEIAALGVAIWAALTLPAPLLIWTGCLLGWSLLAAAVIDARHCLLPDVLVLPLIPAGILLQVWTMPEQWIDHLAGASIGFALFAAVGLFYRRVRRREGLGLGDAKLLAAAGAWVGWAGLPSVVLLGALFGIVTALIMRMAGREVGRVTELPFGPGLALAFWLVWLYGPLVPA
ncbi:MAG: A24 family peptidase [Alphaproteobacteria bacterium]|nr:A24 family peptidase [Alphaproteobacteria bacterium]